MARCVNIIANIVNIVVALLLLAASGLICWEAVEEGLKGGFRNFVVGVFIG